MAVTKSAPKVDPSPPPAPVPLYAQSSQFRNWRYSKEGLAKVRNDLNVQAVDRVRGMVEAERAQQATASAEASTSSATPPPSAEIEYLTVADEWSLVTYYLTQISALCGAFKFPELVEATAQTYLKRFYLRNTCMDYHPKNVMLTCVFLATKTENHQVTIDAFAGKLKTAPVDILSLEFLVSQSLRFEYKVHHAHLALYGLALDLQTLSTSVKELDLAYFEARKLVKASRLTDAEFVYTPAQIALAALNLANPSLAELWSASKQERLSEPERGTGAEDLARSLKDAGEMVQRGENKVDKEAVKEVDKRLRWARNPEKDPNSALYAQRMAREEAEREEKAQAKAAARPPTKDPFAI